MVRSRALVMSRPYATPGACEARKRVPIERTLPGRGPWPPPGNGTGVVLAGHAEVSCAAWYGAGSRRSDTLGISRSAKREGLPMATALRKAPHVSGGNEEVRNSSTSGASWWPTASWPSSASFLPFVCPPRVSQARQGLAVEEHVMGPTSSVDSGIRPAANKALTGAANKLGMGRPPRGGEISPSRGNHSPERPGKAVVAIETPPGPQPEIR